MDTWRRSIVVQWSAALALLVGVPWFRGGYVLSYDMVWVPRLELGRSDVWGLGTALPRAVPSDAVVALLGAAVDPQVVQRVVLGDLEVADRPCRALAAASGATVVAVDYRLAPESPFPGPVHDCLAAVRWARGLGERLVLLGDSAGGALVAAVSTLLQDAGEPLPVAQLLVYPTLAPPTDTPSMLARADGPFMTRRELEWFWGLYLGGAPADPLAAPLLADDLAGLPPTTVVVAELDPLRDEGRAYAARLGAAGVPVELVEYAGAVHGFWWLDRKLAQADELTADLAHRIRALSPQR